VIVVRVSGYEASNPLRRTYTRYLIKNGAGSVGIETTVDDGEVVAVVLDVEHVAVADRKRLDETHLTPPLRVRAKGEYQFSESYCIRTVGQAFQRRDWRENQSLNRQRGDYFSGIARANVAPAAQIWSRLMAFRAGRLLIRR
jgi:hypothetical protein